jgi:hypothetical protein
LSSPVIAYQADALIRKVLAISCSCVWVPPPPPTLLPGKKFIADQSCKAEQASTTELNTSNGQIVHYILIKLLH